ncbi:MAG: hypothetical protein ABUK01_01255 [Leptospirales bacterium]
MQKKVIYLIILFLTTASWAEIQAQSAGRVLYGTYGAENIGSGGANGAVVSDPSSLLVNPAGLSQINGEDSSQNSLEKESEDTFDNSDDNPLPEGFWDEKDENKKDETSERTFEMQFFSTYGQMTLDRKIVYSGIGLTLFKGTVGIGFLGSLVDGIQGYDESGVATRQLTYRFGDIILGYARESGTLRWGLSAHFMQEYLGTASIYGGGFSFGVQIAPIPIINIGFVAKNLFGLYQRSVGSSNYEKMDTELDLSLAITPPTTNIKIMMSVNKNMGDVNNPTTTRIGVHFLFAKYIFLMGGLQDGNLAFGAGLELPFLKFAYSINRDPLRIGLQHYVDLNFVF